MYIDLNSTQVYPWECEFKKSFLKSRLPIVNHFVHGPVCWIPFFIPSFIPIRVPHILCGIFQRYLSPPYLPPGAKYFRV